MRTYIAYIRTTWKLMMRDRVVLFFNYFLPLMFFVIFAQSMGAGRGGAITQVITMVLILGVLGSGFFGAGLRAVQERELNILRRFKVAPITPLPILIASLVTGLFSYLPSVFLILGIAHFAYRMPVPENLLSLVVLLSLGLTAFRSVGLIIASVVNSMQESQIIIQLLYLPMLFLSGATFPVTALPSWLQIVAQFLPASYLYTGMQGILIRKETLLDNWISAGALLLTMLVATFISMKLFRWEKDEKVSPRAKLWLVAVMLPFLALGGYQAYSKENVAKAKTLFRDMRRNRPLLLRSPRIFTGDGKVIAAGGLLLRNGRIEEIYDSVPPESKTAETVEAAGKTVLPGLIDAHVHLVSPGGVIKDPAQFNPQQAVERALAAYLYSGIVAVKSAGDAPALLRQPQSLIASGENLGADVIQSGKLFTAPGGHGTEYFKALPEAIRDAAMQEAVALPKTPEEAREMVRQLHAGGARAIKAILEAGVAGHLFNRLDVAILNAIGVEARALRLPFSVHTGDARDVRDALQAGANIIEHGSLREQIPRELFDEMARRGVYYDPTLTVGEAFEQLKTGKSDLLDRTLVQQVAPEGLIELTRKAITRDRIDRAQSFPVHLETGMENLRRAWHARVKLITGSDAGNFLVLHGPTVHREIELWVRAGIPKDVALTAATRNTAEALGIGNRVGLIRKGYEASLLLVDGNPLEDIGATERISTVFFKGERVSRSDLFDSDDK